MAVLILFIWLSVGYGLLLDDQLPQYSKYGRSLVLIGGAQADDNAAVHDTIVELSGGVNHAKIGLIVAASANPPDSCNFYTDIFLNRYKALSVYCVPIDLNHISGNSDPQVIENIKHQTGFFFGGGDQQRVIDTFFLNNHVPSPALLAIRERHAAGAVIAGTSAGTACQPTAVMINGGMSWEALRYGAHETESPDLPANGLAYNKDGGIGFFDGFILDSHFSERGREGRLIRLLSETRHFVHGVDWGIGIDEDTALVVTHAGTDQEMGKVIGTHGVFFVDVSKSHIDTSTLYFNIDNVMAHFLTTGDSIFLKNKTIMFSASKRSMTGHEMYVNAITTQDIFGGKRHVSEKPEFTSVATSIFDSVLDTGSFGDTKEKHPRFRVTMSRAVAGAEGYVERKQNFHTDITSYKNLYLKINEV